MPSHTVLPSYQVLYWSPHPLPCLHPFFAHAHFLNILFLLCSISSNALLMLSEGKKSQPINKVLVEG